MREDCESDPPVRARLVGRERSHCLWSGRGLG